MSIVNAESMIRLAEHRRWPSVSFFLPTHILPREVGEDRIRLKNLVRAATERLVAEGMREPEALALLERVKELQADDSFWRETSRGLAVFRAEEELLTIRLDMPVPEQVVVGDRYYIRPLLQARPVNDSFFALALDKNDTRLFRGSGAGIEQLDLGDTPVSFAEALKYDEVSKNLTTHSQTAGRIASRGHQHQGSTYAGHGNAKDSDVEQTVRFARIIERGVTELIKGETLPLVVMGNERVVSAYRDVNDYRHLSDVRLTGASDYLSPQQVHQRALDALAPEFAARLDEEIGALRENEGSALASHDPADIVVAAAEGRVRTLFLDESVGPFGVFDRERHEVRELCDAAPRLLRESKTPSKEGDGECGWDLGDLAAAETALHGGRVLLFSGERPPVDGVAALYRY